MIKYIGSSEVPGVFLRYYVFGDRKNGYSIQITERNDEKSCQYVSRNLFQVLELADKLRRNSVFPCNLGEIMEDLQYDARPD